MANAILTGQSGKKLVGDATPADVLAGKTFSNADSNKLTGTMPNRGQLVSELIINGIVSIPQGYHDGTGVVYQEVDSIPGQTITPGTAPQTINGDQYLDGNITVQGDADLVTGNIKSGANIFGVAGKTSVVDTADATAAAAHILSGYTGYVNGAKITGTIASKAAATYTPGTSSQTIPSGQYLSGTQTISAVAGLSAANIKNAVVVGGVTGTYKGVGTATAARVLTGYTFSTDALSGAFGTMTNMGSINSTLTTQGASYTVPLGYHSGSGKVTASFSNLSAGNVKGGINIGGVVGTYAPLAGYTWIQRTSSFGTSVIGGVCYDQGMFVAVGVSGKLATSTNGTTWTQRTSGFGTSYIQGVCYGLGMFVAVGNSGKIATSTNSTTWTQRTSSFGTSTIKGVCYGEGMFVAVGLYGMLATSTDGITWTQRTSNFGTTNINGICYGQGMFVAVGHDGKIVTSMSGTTWTERTSSFTTSITGVCYGQGMFVAVGQSGELATSPTGTTWTQRTSGFGTSAINGVCYGQGMFVAVGYDGTLATSTDGYTWTKRTSSFYPTDISGVCYGPGMFVAVGYDGMLATSANIH